MLKLTVAAVLPHLTEETKAQRKKGADLRPQSMIGEELWLEDRSYKPDSGSCTSVQELDGGMALQGEH